jgi:DNA-binding MarR family transcriptional regulator
MAKKTGIKNNTDTIDIENITGSDSSTAQITKHPPERRNWDRKKPKLKASLAVLPEAQDEGMNQIPTVFEPGEPVFSGFSPLSESAATVLSSEDFTLGDFIPNKVILELEPVLEKEPVLKAKPAPRRARKPKNVEYPALKGKPVSKKEPVEGLPEEKESEKEPINTEPVTKIEPDIDSSSNASSDIKEEPVVLTIPDDETESAVPPDDESEKSPSSEKPASRAKVDYAAAEYSSIQAMASLKGFAPLGMLFILMDVLNGSEEGMIRVNRLAKALSIGKPAMLAQLENLEQAGLIRTTSSSQQGRHIELLISNRVACENFREESAGARLLPDVLPQGAPRNFSLQKLKELQNFLTEHGVQLVALPSESGLSPRLPAIAAFLGKYLSYVQPFYSRLKATLNAGEGIQFSLSGFPGRDVTHILNFCKMLKDVGFLAVFTYHRAPNCMIVARLARTPAAINFLSGGWLEHYIRDKVVSIVTTHPATMDTPYAFMKNPRIILPGGEDFEFDFLILIGASVFWIEAKTGEYMDYIAKYSRVSRLLDLNRNSNLLVLADAPKPDANISARYGISCCGVDEFSEVFRLSMVRELARSKRAV